MDSTKKQEELFAQPSARPKKSKAWKWKPISATSWELRDPRAPRDVYRIVVARTLSRSHPNVYVATGPGNFRGEYFDLDVAKRACRKQAQRREGGRKRRKTMNSMPEFNDR